MDKLVFKRIVIEGYRNFQKATAINIDRTGVTLVKGSNEAGKTTIWDALYFCLEGQNFAGSNKDRLPTWEDKRTEDFRGTRVVVDLQKGPDTYRVARHIDFKGTTKGKKGGNTLMLFHNDLLVSTGVSGTQAEIDNVLGMSAKVFMSSIIFGQRLVRLIKAPDSDKRKLFDEIFSVLFIPKAREKGKERINKLSTDIATLTYKVETDESTLVTKTADLEDKSKLLADFKADKKKDLASIQTELDTWATDKAAADTKLKELQDAVPKEPIDESKLLEAYNLSKDALEDATTKLNTLKSNQLDFDTEIVASDNKLITLKHQLEHTETKCLHCEQNLPKGKVETAKNNITKLIDEETEVLAQLKISKGEQAKGIPNAEKHVEVRTTERDIAKKSYDTINDKLRANVQRNANITIADAAVETLLTSKRSLDIRFKAVEEKQAPKIDLLVLEEIRTNLVLSIGVDKATITTKSTEKSKLDWWVNKAFGNSGLKAHVFNAMLNRLNMFMERYSAVLGSRVVFSVDLTKASSPFNTTVYRNEREVEYGELSGGAQQSVDIVLAFACHDLVSQTSNINLLIMDEVFEGLDEANTEKVFQLIQTKAEQGQSVYIITHINNMSCKGAGTITITNDGTHSYVQ